VQLSEKFKVRNLAEELKTLNKLKCTSKTSSKATDDRLINKY
jgi:hypothetical protein